MDTPQHTRLHLENPNATIMTDQVGLRRIVVLATDAKGRVWIKTDALSPEPWRRMTDAGDATPLQ